MLKDFSDFPTLVHRFVDSFSSDFLILLRIKGFFTVRVMRKIGSLLGCFDLPIYQKNLLSIYYYYC